MSTNTNVTLRKAKVTKDLTILGSKISSRNNIDPCIQQRSRTFSQKQSPIIKFTGDNTTERQHASFRLNTHKYTNTNTNTTRTAIKDFTQCSYLLKNLMHKPNCDPIKVFLDLNEKNPNQTNAQTKLKSYASSLTKNSTGHTATAPFSYQQVQLAFHGRVKTASNQFLPVLILKSSEKKKSLYHPRPSREIMTINGEYVVTKLNHFVRPKIGLAKPLDFTKSEVDKRIFSKKITELIVKESDGVYKRRLIEEYISCQKAKKLNKEHAGYRRIFAILDGTVILTHQLVQGHFVDIPSYNELKIMSKKMRVELFKELLETCTMLFHHPKLLKNIALPDHTLIFDLLELPESEQYVFVSSIDRIMGISLICTRNRNKLRLPPTHTTLPKPESSPINISNNQNSSESDSESIINNQPDNKLNLNKWDHTRQFRLYKKRIKVKHLSSQANGVNKTFSSENGIVNEKNNNEEWEWVYISDDENTRKEANLSLSKFCTRFYDYYVYFHRASAKYTTLQLKSKLSKSNEDVTRIYDNLDKPHLNINNLCAKIRRRRLKKKPFAKAQNEGTGEQSVSHALDEFLLNIEILKKGTTGNEDFYIKFKHHQPLKYIAQNKNDFSSVYIKRDKLTNKYYPSLYAFNFPKLIQTYSNFNFNSGEFSDLFAEYKTLIAQCMAMNKNLKSCQGGVESKAFKFCNGVLEMSSEDKELRGKLSFADLYEISMMSLRYSLKCDNNVEEVLKELGHCFALFLFKLLDMVD